MQQELDSIGDSIARNFALQAFAYLVAYAQGFIFRARGKHQAAFAEFAKSAALNGEFFRADAQKAAQRIYLDDLQGAMQLIEEAISNTPSGSPAFANEKWTAGRIKFFMGDYHAAINLLGESIKLNNTLWYTVAYKCSAYSYIDLNTDAELLLEVLEKEFNIKTLQDVIDREKLNPTAESRSVEAGRRRLHAGLVKAGLQLAEQAAVTSAQQVKSPPATESLNEIFVKFESGGPWRLSLPAKGIIEQGLLSISSDTLGMGDFTDPETRHNTQRRARELLPRFLAVLAERAEPLAQQAEANGLPNPRLIGGVLVLQHAKAWKTLINCSCWPADE